MHNGPDQATIVIEDNVQNAENEISPQCYKDGYEINQYSDCHYVSPVDAI